MDRQSSFRICFQNFPRGMTVPPSNPKKMEPWEALDLDYSDVHSLLRPLKRHRSPQPLSASEPTAATSSSALHCQSQSDNHQPGSNFSSQIPICQSRRVFTEVEPPCPFAPSSSRLIPGPAGAVQAAMQRRTRGDSCFYVGDEEPVPTQEYIRRVMENGDEEDDDFGGNQWLCALDFARGLGAMEGNGAVSETPLSSIKNGFNAEKVALVVAIIKSCTSNGLGGMMVTLKDPTGTIDASIHHSVISEGNFGKDLSVGAVLMLKKVAVFSPTRFVHVLNVTSSNVIKVISKDSGPHIEHNNPTAIRQPDFITGETMPQKNLYVSRETTKNIMNNLRQSSKSSNCKGSGNNRNQQTIVEKDSAVMNPGMSKGISNLSFNTFLVDQDQETGQDEYINRGMGTDTSELSQAKENDVAAANATQVPHNQEAETINEVKKADTRTQGPLLPQWTDEQLDELFVFD